MPAICVQGNFTNIFQNILDYEIEEPKLPEMEGQINSNDNVESLVLRDFIKADVGYTAGCIFNATYLPVRDTKWLTLLVCPKFIKKENLCSKFGDKAGEEARGLNCDVDSCIFAHPGEHVKIDENCKVVVCYDFIKREKCSHRNCKYFHPPKHLADYVLRQGYLSKRIIQAPNSGPMVSLIDPGNFYNVSSANSSDLTLADEKRTIKFLFDYNSECGNINPEHNYTNFSDMFQNTSSNVPIIANSPGHLWIPNNSVKRQNYSNSSTDLQTSEVNEFLGVDPTNVCGNSVQNSSSGCSSKSSTAGSSTANSPPQNLLLVSNSGPMPNILNHHAVAQLQQAGIFPSITTDADCSTVNNKVFSGALCSVASSTNQNSYWAFQDSQNLQSNQPVSNRNSENQNHLFNNPTSFAAHSFPQQTNSANQGVHWTGIPNLNTVAGLCGTTGNTATSAVNLDASQFLAAAALMNGNGGHQSATSQQQLFNMYLRSQHQLATGPSASPGAIPLLNGIPSSATAGPSPLTYLAAQNSSLSLTNLLNNPQNVSNPSSQIPGFNVPTTANLNSAFNPQAVALSMYYLDQTNQLNMHLAGSTFGLAPIQNPITNVAYMNEKGQLLESLPICRDFKAAKCHRHSECRYVHLIDDNVEVNQGRVTICRDAAKGRCSRTPCKYFHIPAIAITASRSLAFANSQAAYYNSQSTLPGSNPYLGASLPTTGSSMLFCEPSGLPTAAAHI